MAIHGVIRDTFGGGVSTKTSAPQSFNSATPANVTGASFAVTAGRLYKFTYYILGESDTQTVGIQLGVTCPAFTFFAGRVLSPSGATDVSNNHFAGYITSSGDMVVPAQVPTAAQEYLFTVEGVIRPSASGAVQLQAATETGTTVVTVDECVLTVVDLGA